MNKLLLVILMAAAPAVSHGQNAVYLQPGQSFYVPAINTVVNCAYGNPGSVGAQCQLFGVGPFQNFNYTYRVAINNSVIQGTDFLGSALTLIRDLKARGACSAQPARPCVLVGPGPYNGFNFAYRVDAGYGLIHGTDFYSNAIQMIQQLRGNGVCY
jgi:hypothetical protein